MKIGGLQKLTLLDYPGLVACTVFTVGCNLRCPFCHNASLVTHTSEPEFTAEEVLAFLDTRKGKLDGVCVTGGEPLLQPDLAEFLAAIKEKGFCVKLDTNGTYPARLREILSSGAVDFVAMDIKNSPEKYARTVGIEGFDISPVLESVRIIRESGIAHEFRTTAVGGLHTAEDFSAIGAWLKGEKRYYIQGFVDSGDTIAPGLSPCTTAEMNAFLESARADLPESALRGM